MEQWGGVGGAWVCLLHLNKTHLSIISRIKSDAGQSRHIRQSLVHFLLCDSLPFAHDFGSIDDGGGLLLGYNAQIFQQGSCSSSATAITQPIPINRMINSRVVELVLLFCWI